MTDGTDAAEARRFERARRAVFGHLGAAVLHETNNVLTVMAGVRQLTRSGATLSDRIGTMIDEQLARMERLVGAIRAIGPEDNLGDDAAPRQLPAIAAAIADVLRIAGKGRSLALELGDLPKLAPSSSEALALATLCVLLPLLPPRGGEGSARVALRGTATAGAVTLSCTCAPLRHDGIDPDEALAAELLAALGGSLHVARSADGCSVTLTLPLATGAPRR